MMWRALILCFLLGACTAPQAVVSFHDDWTGIDMITTREQEIFRDRQGVMLVRPAITSRGGQYAFGIVTRIYRLVPNGPIIEKIESNGTPLRYKRTDRLLTQCTDACRRTEIGVIHLTEAEFRNAARSGLPLRVFGRRGRYAGFVPPEPLQRLLAQSDAAKALATP
jgi:hypothetical protein